MCKLTIDLVLGRRYSNSSFMVALLFCRLLVEVTRRSRFTGASWNCARVTGHPEVTDLLPDCPTMLKLSR